MLAGNARGDFAVTLSAPGQAPGFIWICNSCRTEATTPATLYRDLETDYQGHTCAGDPYAELRITEADDPADFIVTWAAKGGPTRIYV